MPLDPNDPWSIPEYLHGQTTEERLTQALHKSEARNRAKNFIIAFLILGIVVFIGVTFWSAFVQ